MGKCGGLTLLSNHAAYDTLVIKKVQFIKDVGKLGARPTCFSVMDRKFSNRRTPQQDKKSIRNGKKRTSGSGTRRSGNSFSYITMTNAQL